MAEEKKADTIIIGSHGRTGLKRLLMGSVTEKVIGHAPCTVLVVKRQHKQVKVEAKEDTIRIKTEKTETITFVQLLAVLA